MTPEAQRIAIAEACGWTTLCNFDRTICGWHAARHPREHHKYPTPIPDYLNDLNAMHEAEKVLTDEQWNAYTDILFNLVPDVPLTMRMGPAMRYFIHATAAQRAEAFLRTIGKWEDKP